MNALALMLFTGALVGANEPVLSFDWKELAAANTLRSGAYLPADEKSPSRLRLENTGGATKRLVFLEVFDPKIAGQTFAMIGTVRHEEVKGDAYLEMLVTFPNGQTYFTRTLGQSGAMGKLTGTTGWRDFSLPFQKDGYPAPKKLEFAVIFPDAGAVELGPMTLHDHVNLNQAWWTDRQGGIIGGIAGSLIGILGAVLGYLASRGLAASVIQAVWGTIAAVGGIVFVVGVVAVVCHQPYGVYYPLLLIGFLAAVIGGSACLQVSRTQRQRELRRMEAMDT